MRLTLSEKIGQYKGSKTAEVDVEPTTTVLELRSMVGANFSVRVNNIIVFLDGEFLEAEHALQDYGVTEQSVLTFEIKMCGPVPINRDWSAQGYKRKLTIGAGTPSGSQALPM